MSWETGTGRSVKGNCSGWNKWWRGPEWNRRKTRPEIDKKELKWNIMDNESARKIKGWRGRGGGEGAQKTSSWRKEKGVHSGVQVMVSDILFWGKRKEWDSSDSGTNLGLSNRTPRCFHLEKAHRRLSEPLHKVGRIRCWWVGVRKKKKREGLMPPRAKTRWERGPKTFFTHRGSGQCTKRSMSAWTVEKHFCSSCITKTLLRSSLKLWSCYHKDGEKAQKQKNH